MEIYALNVWIEFKKSPLLKYNRHFLACSIDINKKNSIYLSTFEGDEPKGFLQWEHDYN